MELINIKQDVFYISDRVNSGLVLISDKAVLIDSGIDDEHAKKILNILSGQGVTLRAIINTHSHADHCGGNSYLKRKTDASIYAPEMESSIIECPYIEPVYLYSGANPIDDLKNKFLMANASSVDHVIKKNEQAIEVEGKRFSIVPLPGHSPNQIGILVDGVLFCADSIFPQETIAKHKILFHHDIEKSIRSLEYLKGSSHEYYLPSHGQLMTAIADLAEQNIKSIQDICKYIHDVPSPFTTEFMINEIAGHYNIEIKNTQQYYLTNSVVMAYLSYLKNEHKLDIQIEDNTLKWRCK